jgi:hypothetical protein
MREPQFQIGHTYVYTSAGGVARAVKMLSPFDADFSQNNLHRLHVNTVHINFNLTDCDLPYGITDTTGPWYLVSDDPEYEYAVQPRSPDPNTFKFSRSVKSTKDGLGLDFDTRAYI